ncbi:urea ABC transporter permease subunit UrtC [Burkholderia humptydooensis]|uniref:Urea ABC transporter permease subunit UrtC n=3 Tax=Burkholderia humptydooensis TaxID=430531 RepID=A0A7U4P2H0_9BURK|nr:MULTISPECIES: urea ABC transporter permease subunit UrtC [Burkholderia]AJY41627.1 urea ABC transporter, permease protein UrtC [Burkholderia sp. 2002721687]ALX41784.1 urea ABC transporter permease subunit UrtC [Burkholderia humptydooensis]EIP88439.1 putative amino acid ABC transporter, permease protein [Burkholderia humptydooensis MSMB43]QPS43041.1 urea ABC transporter permease subunit UrtC [Burkholderia humptydooensis]
MTSTIHSLSVARSASSAASATSAAPASPRFALGLPPRPALLSRRAWLALVALCIAVGVGVPLAALAAPESSAFHLSSYAMTLAGKLMCYAIAALALDLVWGYCGILSLGHGLFFALGGYAIGMYLMRAIGRDGKYGSDLPDFMVFLDWHRLPWYWSGTEHLAYALALVVLAPAALAWAFGFFTFRSRVKGVYLSIITQAMTFAAMLLFYRNETGFGGNNGFTDFKRIAGFAITSPGTRTVLFLITFAALVASFVAARAIVTTKLGRVVTAIRDGETRVMFLGYSPLAYKLFVWVVSAVLCGIAGALYVPQVGIINPSEMSPGNSIEMAIWVAVGGRGTLIGPIVGAFAVNGAKSVFTAYFAEYWLFFLGLIFVLVPLVLPRGIMGLVETVTRRATPR